MKTFKEFEEFHKIKTDKRRELRLKLYREYMTCMENIINNVFGNKDTCIALNSFMDDYRIEAICVGIHSDTIYLKYDEENSKMCIQSYKAHDAYYDPILQKQFFEDDEEVIGFFDQEFDHFESLLYIYSRHDPYNPNQNIVSHIINDINKQIYDQYKSKINEMKWGYDDFIKSDFAFSVEKGILEKCDKFIDVYHEKETSIRDEISKLASLSES